MASPSPTLAPSPTPDQGQTVSIESVDRIGNGLVAVRMMLPGGTVRTAIVAERDATVEDIQWSALALRSVTQCVGRPW